MQAMRIAPAVFAVVAVGATDTNPLAKVLDLMDECTAKVKADGEAEAKAYKEYFEWCDDVAKNTQFEIKTAKASVEKLTASIAKLTSDIEVGTSKIEDLAGSIATNEADLKEATGVREKEAADFTSAEAELAKVQKDLADTRKAILEGRGMEAERQRLADEKLEAEKEKRVLHLQQLGIRRLTQQGIARGWTAWLEGYLEYRRKANVLRHAGARLARPKFIAAFVHWQRDWEADMVAKATMTAEERIEAAEAIAAAYALRLAFGRVTVTSVGGAASIECTTTDALGKQCVPT